jgi:hypothetical protein
MYDEAPMDAKPECRPWLVITLSGLVTQTTKEILKLSDHLKVVVHHADCPLNLSSRLRV